MEQWLRLGEEVVVEEPEPVAAERPGFFHVLFGMIVHPVRTLDQGLAHPVQRYAWAFAALGGLYLGHVVAALQGFGRLFHLYEMLTWIVILGPPLGIAFLYVGGLLVNWASDVLEGHAPRKKVRSLLGYAGVPGIVAHFCFGGPRILIFGDRLFTEGYLPPGDLFLGTALLLGDAVCLAWSIALLIHGMRTITGFSQQRVVGMLLLASAPVLLVAAVAGLVVVLGRA